MDPKTLIQKHEGFRDRVYLDTEGIPTVGWGHAFIAGSKVSREICEMLFESDYAVACRDYTTLGLTLNPVRRSVIINMLFNLGLPRFLGFRKMIDALRKGDYSQAAAEMCDSKWAKQVGSRADNLAEMMRTGKDL